MSKEERAEIALKKRQEEVAAKKKSLEASQSKYLDTGSSGNSNRKRDGRDEEKEKRRDGTFLQKDKEREIEAIKVTNQFVFIVFLILFFSHAIWEQTKNAEKCVG